MKFKIVNGLQISELTLGTAQLGFQYGISNQLGKPNLIEAEMMLNEAIKNGINTFDTAPVYGDSESIIGNFFKKNQVMPITIITKIPKIQLNSEHPSFTEIYDEIKSILGNSKNSLKQEIQICLLHNPSDIHAYDGLVVDSLIRLKKEGLVKLIGVSTYTPQDVEEFMQIPNFDTIQVPVNLFDTRLIKNGFLSRLNDLGKIIFARSIFLQGLFFMNVNNLTPDLQIAKNSLEKLQKISSEFHISIHSLAFNFVRGIKELTSIIFGAESVKQLQNNINLLNYQFLSDNLSKELEKSFTDMPEKLINPSKWSKSYEF